MHVGVKCNAACMAHPNEFQIGQNELLWPFFAECTLMDSVDPHVMWRIPLRCVHADVQMLETLHNVIVGHQCIWFDAL